MRNFFFIIPEFPKAVTGGTLYDLNLFKELKNKYFPIKKISVELKPKNTNLRILSKILNLPHGSTVCIDGLLTPYLKNCINLLCGRFNIILLIHHPVTQENNFFPLLNLKDYFLERSIFNKKLKIITVSHFIKKELQKYMNKYKKIYVAEPGIEDIFFMHYKYKETSNIISVGNVIPRKGYHVLIDALAEVSGDWSLTIVGNYEIDIKYYNELKLKIKKFDLHNKIKFIGVISRETMLNYMREAKLFVLPTLFEGYGISILEAAIMGLQVITTDLPVLRESLKGKDVQFVNYCETTSLSLAIEENLKKEHSRNKIKNKFIHSWGNTRKKFLEAVNGKT